MINTHPQDMLNVIPGTNATFTVTATGLRLNYTWKLGNRTTLPSDDRLVPNDKMLTVQNVRPSDIGSYCCEVSNAAGSVTSNSASLTLSELYLHVKLDFIAMSNSLQSFYLCLKRVSCAIVSISFNASLLFLLGSVPEEEPDIKDLINLPIPHAD